MNGENGNRTKVEEIIATFVSVGKADPLFRDLYLEKARTLITPLLGLDQYRLRMHQKQELEFLHHQSQGAVERNDWQQARELAVRISAAQRIATEGEPVMKLAAEAYDAPEVVLDPFSPGLHGFIGSTEGNRVELRERLLQQFALLEREDPEWKDFHASRRSWFEKRITKTAGNGGAETASVDPEQLRREALQAVERGDVTRFDDIMAALQREQSQSVGGNGDGDDGFAKTEPREETVLGVSDEAAARGRSLGFTAVSVPAAPEAAAYLNKYAWQPAASPPQFNPDGSIRLPAAPSFTIYPPETVAKLMEMIGLFTIHPFITSVGYRYLPQCPEEQLLVEDFPEGPGREEPGEMMKLLNLPRRWGLSRSAVEQALLLKGPAVLREKLDLDPFEYRIVCIPADAYCRLGRTMQWGLQEQWTHFDGYQILQNASLRALVGGDVRYGGTFDLCSISRNDERQEVVARFAIVRRNRLAGRG